MEGIARAAPAAASSLIELLLRVLLREGMVTSGGPPLNPSKLINRTIFDSLWVCGAFGGILISIVSNSHFGKRLGARYTLVFMDYQ